MSEPILQEVGPDDPWPEAVSNGLASACWFCNVTPVVDYTVDDDWWREHVPAAAHSGVVCLECLVARAPETPLHITRLMVSGAEATTVFSVERRYRWLELSESEDGR